MWRLPSTHLAPELGKGLGGGGSELVVVCFEGELCSALDDHPEEGVGSTAGVVHLGAAVGTLLLALAEHSLDLLRWVNCGVIGGGIS